MGRGLKEQETDAGKAGWEIATWDGRNHRYRLRLVDGQFVVERLHYRAGTWRRMSYSQDLVDQMGRMAMSTEPSRARVDG